jgi:hypothetical protein
VKRKEDGKWMIVSNADNLVSCDIKSGFGLELLHMIGLITITTRTSERNTEIEISVGGMKVPRHGSDFFRIFAGGRPPLMRLF